MRQAEDTKERDGAVELAAIVRVEVYTNEAVEIPKGRRGVECLTNKHNLCQTTLESKRRRLT